MKGLSIKQPWAWLIVHGLRDVETRDWPTKFRGRIYVHASGWWDTAAGHREALALLSEKFGESEARQQWLEMRKNARVGCIIGEVNIVDCTDDPCLSGKYRFLLDDPVAYEEPVPYRGGFGLFEVNPAKAKAQARKPRTTKVLHLRLGKAKFEDLRT